MTEDIEGESLKKSPKVLRCCSPPDEVNHQAGKVGVFGMLVGAVVSFFFFPVGVAIIVAGLTTTMITATNKLDAIRKAATALNRALDDLEECVRK